jgi:hypothetical protein
LLRNLNDLTMTTGVRGESPKMARFPNALKNLTHIPNKTSTSNCWLL